MSQPTVGNVIFIQNSKKITKDKEYVPQIKTVNLNCQLMILRIN